MTLRVCVCVDTCNFIKKRKNRGGVGELKSVLNLFPDNLQLYCSTKLILKFNNNKSSYFNVDLKNCFCAVLLRK